MPIAVVQPRFDDHLPAVIRMAWCDRLGCRVNARYSVRNLAYEVVHHMPWSGPVPYNGLIQVADGVADLHTDRIIQHLVHQLQAQHRQAQRQSRDGWVPIVCPYCHEVSHHLDHLPFGDEEFSIDHLKTLAGERPRPTDRVLCGACAAPIGPDLFRRLIAGSVNEVKRLMANGVREIRRGEYREPVMVDINFRTDGIGEIVAGIRDR